MSDSNAAKLVGVFFKEARLDMGVTQKDAAIAAQVTLAQIKQYEAGILLPRLTTALALCHFYDVSWNSLEPILLASNNEAPDPAPAPTAIPGPNSKLSRPETRAFGRHIVIDRLTERGWQIIETNSTGAKSSNFDVKAEKDGNIVRLKVTTKQHPTKTTLTVRWEPDQQTFNLNPNKEAADYLVMVRFTGGQDQECLVLPITVAEEKSDWLAHEMTKLGNVPMYLQPYIGPPRNSRFKFNTREVWEPYYEAWDILSKIRPD